MPAARAAGVGAAFPELFAAALRAQLFGNGVATTRGAPPRPSPAETRQGLEADGAVQATESHLLLLVHPSPRRLGSLAPTHAHAPRALVPMFHTMIGGSLPAFQCFARKLGQTDGEASGRPGRGLLERIRPEDPVTLPQPDHITPLEAFPGSTLDWEGARRRSFELCSGAEIYGALEYEPKSRRATAVAPEDVR